MISFDFKNSNFFDHKEQQRKQKELSLEATEDKSLHYKPFTRIYTLGE